MFVLSDSGVSAKPAQDEPPLYSTQFLLTAGSPPPHWSLYSRFCDCWSEMIWVQSATSHKQTNKPGSNTSPRQSYSSYHLPFVSPPVFLVVFYGSSQTISNWYGLEKLQDFFSLLNQTSSEEFLHPFSGKGDELKPGSQERMRVSVLSTSIATEKRAQGTEPYE